MACILMPEFNAKTMKLSTFTLGALLASASATQAQTAYKNSLHADTVRKHKTPSAQITEKHHHSQTPVKTENTTTKEKKRPYCPACGRG